MIIVLKCLVIIYGRAVSFEYPWSLSIVFPTISRQHHIANTFERPTLYLHSAHRTKILKFEKKILIL